MGLTATYEGEGANVSGSLNVANVPDVQAASVNATTTGQGMQASLACDRRRRLRTTSEGMRSAVAINYASTDQVLATYARGIHISTTGTLVGRLADDTADQTFVFGAVGFYPYSFALIRHSGSSSAAGLLLF
jgi:hypothetical protein